MCTVSIIPVSREGVEGSRGRGDRWSGFRLVSNRDERHDRADAAPPRWRELSSVSRGRAIWPADGEAGGTWIGATDRGLLLSLLNLNPEEWVSLPDSGRLLSRGRVIPTLLEKSSGLLEVAGEIERLELDRLAPFRLVGVELTGEGLVVLEAAWDRRDVAVMWFGEAPICFASSGLGDRLVTPRLGLFEEMVAGPISQGARSTAAVLAQDAFHAHVWPDRPQISVMMNRAEARTVSVTSVEVMFAIGATGRAESSLPLPSVKMGYRPTVSPVVGVSTGAAVPEIPPSGGVGQASVR